MKSKSVFWITFALACAVAGAGCSSSTTPAAATLTVTGSTKSTTAALSLFKKVLELASTRSALATTTIGTPTEVKIKVYGMWLSTSADCSSPVEVANYGTTGVEKDFSSGEVLFTGTPPDGTYKCMIIKMADQIKFVPDAAAVAAWPAQCAASTQYTFDVYRAGDTSNVDMDGAVITGHGDNITAAEDILYLYASTDVAQAKASNGASVTAQATTLTSALVVPGASTFFADATDQVEGQVDTGHQVCKFEGITFGFR